MKLKYYINTKILSLILLSIIVTMMLVSGASATWADTNLAYKTNVSIIDGLRPYQISLNISNSTGANTATQINCNGYCNVNFTDIRFYLNDVTPLPYWIEDNTTGKVWVNVTVNGSVQMYYGNTTYLTTSNGNTTFTFFDHFLGATYDTNKWQPGTSSPIISVANSNLTLTGNDANWDGFASKQNLSANSTLSYKVVAFQNVGTTAGIQAGYSLSLTTYGTTDTLFRHKALDVYTRDGVTASTIAKAGIQVPAIYSIKRNGTVDNTFSINYGSETTKTNNIPAGSLNASFWTTADTAVGQIVLDWVYVRNTTYPELTWGTWGAQESHLISLISSSTLPSSIFKCQPSIITATFVGSGITNVFAIVSSTKAVQPMVIGSGRITPETQSTNVTMTSSDGLNWTGTFGNDNTLLWGERSISYVVINNGTNTILSSSTIFVYSDACTGTGVQNYTQMPTGLGKYTKKIFNGQESNLLEFALYSWVEVWGYLFYFLTIATISAVIYLKTQQVTQPLVVGLVLLLVSAGTTVVPPTYRNAIVFVIALILAVIYYRVFTREN